MHNADRFNLMTGVSFETLFNLGRIDSMAPTLCSRHTNELGLNPQTICQFIPQSSKVSGLVHQDQITR